MHSAGFQFVEEIAELTNCRVAKFSGLIFAKQPISEGCPDGLPTGMAALQRRGDFEIVGIPPSLVQRAAEAAKVREPPGPVTNFCAVFEKYGADGRGVESEADWARKREEDIQLQMEAWCDFGESMRTETDMLHPDGPDLFLESHSDMAE